MSENKHTPGPWVIGRPPPNGEQTIGDKNGLMVAVATTGYGVNSEANARRVVACVNRLAQFTTEQIEDFGYDLFAEDRPRLVEAQNEIHLLKKQRDELLAALEKMSRAYVILMESARDRICDLGGECDGIEVMERNDPYLRESRAAIANVKGEHP